MAKALAAAKLKKTTPAAALAPEPAPPTEPSEAVAKGMSKAMAAAKKPKPVATPLAIVKKEPQESEEQRDFRASARRLVREAGAKKGKVSELLSQSGEVSGILQEEADRVRQLRTIMRAWGQHVANELASRRALESSTTVVTPLEKGRSVYEMLSKQQQHGWPKAWSDFFGWQISWREAAEWLASIGVTPTISIEKLIAGLKSAELYVHIMRLLIREGYIAARHKGKSPRSKGGELKDANELILDFFEAHHVRATLGAFNCRSIKLDEHLTVLAYMRVVMEVDSPDKYVAFFRGAGLSSARIPALPEPPPATVSSNRRSPKSPTASQVSEGSPKKKQGCNHTKYSAWCEHCGTLAIAQHHLNCDKCAVRTAIVELEETCPDAGKLSMALFDRV